MSIAEKLTTIAENVPKVYEAGQQAMKDTVEKAITDNWTRYYYAYAFMNQDWSGFVFSKPIIPTGSIINMFNNYSGKYLPKNIDLSQAATGSTSRQRLFYYADVVEIYDIGLIASVYDQTFRGCSKLKKIAKIGVSEKNTFSYAFSGCSVLEEITVEGTIGTDISFSYSPLSIESMKNIISCLKDYSGTDTTHTLTFKADRETMLTDEEKAVATDKGWTLVWS